ncbi:hypothetical protein [Dokdonella soli]|uniref:Uncharacterized protein n=1 Tax=Dokdonella soli TaxID=529810 RepID=A0ABN1IFB2_9GAMM
MHKLPDLPNSVQLASEAPDSKAVFAFESLKVGKLPDLPGAMQLASEVPDSKSTIAVFAAAEVVG